MLYDGTREAIKLLRERKNLSQAEAAKRADEAEAAKWASQAKAAKRASQAKAAKRTRITGDTWSKIETGSRKSLGKEELDWVMEGLSCTETELWRVVRRLEENHYRKMESDIGEDAPAYDASLLASQVEAVLQLDLNKLPLEQQRPFHDLSNTTAQTALAALGMLDRVKAMYRSMRDSKAQEEPQPEN